MQPVFLHRSSARIPNGGARLNFAHYSYFFMDYWHPKGKGAWHHGLPPTYAPDYTQKHQNDGAITLYNIENYITNSVKKRNNERLCH